MPRSCMAVCSGVASSTTPQPEVKVSRCRTVIGRSTAVVRSSGASGTTRTRGLAASGNQRAIGSSRPSTPFSTRLSVRAPPIGLVIDAIRNSESSPIASLSAPTALRPPALTATRPRTRTAAT